MSWREQRCTRCRHTFEEHEASASQPQISPCTWVSLDYNGPGAGHHCTCFAFTDLPVDRPALSEIGRQIDILTEMRDKIGHDGLHGDFCSKCKRVARINDRLGYLGAL